MLFKFTGVICPVCASYYFPLSNNLYTVHIDFLRTSKQDKVTTFVVKSEQRLPIGLQRKPGSGGHQLRKSSRTKIERIFLFDKNYDFKRVVYTPVAVFLCPLLHMGQNVSPIMKESQSNRVNRTPSFWTEYQKKKKKGT